MQKTGKRVEKQQTLFLAFFSKQ